MALAACSESSQPLPQEVQFQFTGGIPECDYQSIQRQVYFDRPERNTVKDTVRAMKAAANDGDVATATEIGFDVIAGWIVPGAPIEDETQRERMSDLINSLLACMTLVDAGPDGIIGTSDDIAAYPGPDGETGTSDDIPVAPAAAIDFTHSLSDSGAIGVRGGLLDPAEEPVVSALCTFVLGTPCPDGTWGIEPANSASTGFVWGDVTGDQSVLFYGAKTDDVPGGGEAQVTEAFDWEKVPDIAFVDADVRVARCKPEVFAERVQEIEPAVVRVLPVSEPTFCAFTAPTESGLFGMLKSWTRTASGGLLFPQRLHASASPGRCCGGSCPDFTPFVVVNAGNVNLTFESQPADAVIDESGLAQIFDANGEPVTVSAKGNNGTPLPEVVITLSIEVNQSSWAELSGNTADTTDVDCTAASGCTPNGLAEFTDLYINKPGGYTLIASAVLLGYDNITPIRSDAFHVKQ
jgi:hypothetical protein